MKTWHMVDAEGVVVSRGSCDDESYANMLVPDGLVLREGWADLPPAKKRGRPTLTYRQRRAREYPPVGDQLDALWKGGAEAAAMRAKVDAVKVKYPKE